MDEMVFDWQCRVVAAAERCGSLRSLQLADDILRSEYAARLVPILQATFERESQLIRDEQTNQGATT
jgi:hypothetical protein